MVDLTGDDVICDVGLVFILTVLWNMVAVIPACW